MNPLPQYLPNTAQKWPIDGWLIETPGHCKRADHAKCAAFYADIALSKGVHRCPSGYACYSGGDGNFYSSGLRVKNVSDMRKLEARSHPAYYPEFTESDVMAIVARYERAAEPFIKINRTLPGLQQSIENAIKTSEFSRDLALTIAHEIRNFNRDIKSSAEEVLWQIDANEHPDLPAIKEKGQTIFALSSLISVRLSTLDFDNNPTSITAGGTTDHRVHSKFYKARQCLTEWAHRNGEKRIDLEGNCFKTIPLFQIFDLLPFLILENAVKYAPFGEVILVVFDRDAKSNTVTVSSYGPPVEQDELAALGTSTFRTRAAQEYVRPGTGLGLKLVRKIAEMHKMTVEFGCDGPERLVNGKSYRKFSVVLHY